MLLGLAQNSSKMHRRAFIMAGALLALAPRALAHSLKELEDSLMANEKYFQPADGKAADFTLQDANGHITGLKDLKGKVVVLHFIYTNCPDTCPLHAEKIAEIQKMVNISPMKGQVQFVSITTDPKRDTGQVLREFGQNHGLDPINWTFLTTTPAEPETLTLDLAKTYGVEFKPMANGDLMHGVLTIVIDQDGQIRGRFHGLEFQSLNLVMFVNALVNKIQVEHHHQEPGFWAWLTRFI